MKRSLMVLMSFCAFTLMQSCGGGGGGSSDGPSPSSSAGSATITTPKTITTESEVARTADASVTIASQVSSSGVTSLTSTVAKAAKGGTASGRRVLDNVLAAQRELRELLMKKNVGKTSAAITHTETETLACDAGGTLTKKTTISLDGRVSATYTYNECKENNSKKNGVIFIKSNSIMDPTELDELSDIDLIMGSSLTSPYEETFYSGTGYTHATEKQQMFIKLSINSAEDIGTSSSGDMSISGVQEYFYYDDNFSEKNEYTNFRIIYNYSEFLNGSSNTDATMSGAYKYSRYGNVVMSSANLVWFEDSTFQNFRLQSNSDANGVEQIRIDGLMAYVSQPECMSGTYNITTQSPIIINSSGDVTSGQITVNGVVILFTADGSITAILNGIPTRVTDFADVCTI